MNLVQADRRHTDKHGFTAGGRLRQTYQAREQKRNDVVVTNSSKRFVSDPLLNMLQAASVSPAAVHKAIVAQAEKYGYAVLRARHPYIRRVRIATGLKVTDIALRYNRLLVSIEQIDDKRIHWFYREFKGSYCSFRCPRQLPETIMTALRGKPFVVVTEDIKPLLDVAIVGLDEEYDGAGWLNLKLAPAWISF